MIRSSEHAPHLRLPIQMLSAEDFADAVAFLVSDEAHFITGTAWPLDAGFTVS